MTHRNRLVPLTKLDVFFFRYKLYFKSSFLIISKSQKNINKKISLFNYRLFPIHFFFPKKRKRRRSGGGWSEGEWGA